MWSKVKAFVAKVWSALIGWLESIRRDRLYHFICGILIGAFFGISLHMGVWAFIPALFVGFIKEFVDQWRYGGFDWVDLLATTIGGVVISLCFLV